MHYKFIFICTLAVIICGCAGNADSSVKGGQYYQNPVLGGDYPDPSIIRVGNDFYMTHSSFEYLPGLLVWHSTDLIHWKRISHALTTYVGSVWAPDIAKHGDMWYIYFPAARKNWVVTALSPEGPWSVPVEIQASGIDPGHLTAIDGKRYLYFPGINIVPLSDDGLSVTGPPISTNYSGWEYPDAWNTECFCLEGPKATIRNGYYYLTSAQGGTAGPSTAHMAVAARSRSPFGPFENSPFNPIVHTENRAERWWNQGHGTLVDDVNGNWWIMYHAYEKGFHTLGRQTMLLPIVWTDDDWFRVPEGVNSGDLLPIPAGQPFTDISYLSDDFSSNNLGLQWQFFKRYEPERVNIGNGKLTLKAQGASFAESSPLLVNAGDRHYETTVEYWIEGGVTAGLVLFYDEQANVRIAVDEKQFMVFNQKSMKTRDPNSHGNHGFLRIHNDYNEVNFYHSADGKHWFKMGRSLEVTGFNHNVFYQFLSLRVGLYAFGEGNAVFSNFVYRKIDD